MIQALLYLFLATTSVDSFTPVAARQSSPSRLNFSAKANGDSSSFQHGLCILSMPSTSIDRIANEAILETALRQGADKLSIVLRSADDASASSHSIASLRKYVGEVYSNLWDCEMGSAHPERVLDAIVYVQNLPNSAPEQWIHHVSDLDFCVSHDSICGWISEGAGGRGFQYQNTNGDGSGGLEAYVEAINADRQARDLLPLTAIPADPWPKAASLAFLEDNYVSFLDDDAILAQKDKMSEDNDESAVFLGGAVIPTKSLFGSICVGGTFDGMHYGHRKLLTLAVSSVQPGTGKLLVGVTVDDMLQHKEYAELIPPLEERMQDVQRFLHRLAPGMKNRIRIVPILDTFGPPGSEPDFEALVLSHETLDNGHYLNEHRIKQGFQPLQLLCTRRTEPHGMSSTALRRLRQQAKERDNIRI